VLTPVDPNLLAVTPDGSVAAGFSGVGLFSFPAAGGASQLTPFDPSLIVVAGQSGFAVPPPSQGNYC
jgi:hypothetical protein